VPRTTAPPVLYSGKVVSASTVQSILNSVDLMIIPLVNPDGRDFSLGRTPGINRLWWRKNRRRFAGQSPCVEPQGGLDVSVGVDLNRNFDFAWDPNLYYEAAFVPDVSVSTTRCPDPNQIYHGTQSESEPETRNVANLMRDEHVQYFMDLHFTGPAIYYSWGTCRTGRIPSENYHNPAHDHARRDGKDSGLGVYREYLPFAIHRRIQALAGTLKRSMEVDIKPARADLISGVPLRDNPGYLPLYATASSVDMYPSTGGAQDYHTSLQFSFTSGFDSVANPPIRYSYTMECGSANENFFYPDRKREFRKLSREVQSALWRFLAQAGAPYRGGPSLPVAPAP